MEKHPAPQCCGDECVWDKTGWLCIWCEKYFTFDSLGDTLERYERYLKGELTYEQVHDIFRDV